MKSYKSLVKVFNKATSMDKPKDKATKVKIIVLTIFAVFCIMLPVTVGCGLLVKLATDSLAGSGHESFGLYLMFAFILLFTIVFGMNVIFNELYFSNDIEYLLPLPLRGYEIALAKFTSVFRAENFMQFLLVFACILGYGIASGMGILRWIFALVGGFLLPIVPMGYCAIIGILIMSFTGIIKNKDTIRRISVVIMLLLLIAMAATLGSVKDADLEAFILNVAQGELPFVKAIKVLFPQLGMLIKAVGEGDVLQFIFFLLYNAVIVVIFAGVSELLYVKSVTGLSNESGKKKAAKKDVSAECKKTAPMLAYMRKDFRMLMRTPVFFTNCIGISFIWPLFVFIAAKIKDVDMSVSAVRELYKGSEMFPGILLIFVTAITIIMTAMNSLGSNAFSREGKKFDFIKYIPVPVKDQWNAKALLSILISTFSVVLYVIVFGIYAAVPILHILIFVVLSLLASVMVTYLGMIMDSMRPKLVWDDELSALRENENTFFSMALAIGIAALIGGVQFVLYKVCGLGVPLTGLVTALILLACDALLYHRAMTKGIENILNFEDMS